MFQALPFIHLAVQAVVNQVEIAVDAEIIRAVEHLFPQLEQEQLEPAAFRQLEIYQFMGVVIAFVGDMEQGVFWQQQQMAFLKFLADKVDAEFCIPLCYQYDLRMYGAERMLQWHVLLVNTGIGNHGDFFQEKVLPFVFNIFACNSLHDLCGEVRFRHGLVFLAHIGSCFVRC